MTSIRACLPRAVPPATRAWRALLHRLYISRADERSVVAGFHEEYVASAPRALWMGEPVSVTPLDLWIYQEIVFQTRPDLVVAVDTLNAAYLADVCRMTGRGEVLAASGDGDPPGTATEASERAGRSAAVMVVVGQGRAATDVAQQLAGYGRLVSKGCYLIIEGTTDPARAQRAAEFICHNPSFVVDRSKEKLYFTFNTGGYLRRHR